MDVKRKIGKLSFELPHYWNIEEGAPILLYDADGVGAIQITLYNTKSSDTNIEIELADVIKEEISENPNFQFFDKSNNSISGTIINDRFWFVKLIKKGTLLVLVTYNCLNSEFKESEYLDVVAISNHIEIE